VKFWLIIFFLTPQGEFISKKEIAYKDEASCYLAMDKVNESEDKTIANEVQKLAKIPEDFEVKEIVIKAGYWRKANQIHRWFVEQVQEGKDDCGYYYVSRQHLVDLRDLCKRVIENKDLAAMGTFLSIVNYKLKRRRYKMSYVIYNNETSKILGGHNKSYKTLAAAKSAISRLRKTVPVTDLNTDRDPLFVYAIAEINYFYENIDQTVERVNLMSGKTFRESVNTPSYCSPSSESYWSM